MSRAIQTCLLLVSLLASGCQLIFSYEGQKELDSSAADLAARDSGLEAAAAEGGLQAEAGLLCPASKELINGPSA